MNIMSDLYWRQALWLLFILLPFIIIAFHLLRQQQRWLKIADPELLPWVKANKQAPKAKLKKILLALAWIFFCIALAGPRSAQYIPPSLETDNGNLMVIIDFSASMKAQDGQPDRIASSIHLLQQWLANAPKSLQAGLIIFSGHAHQIIRPTQDHILLKHFLSQLNRFKPPTLGNNLADALHMANETLSQFKGKQYILLFTDGDMDKQAQSAAIAMAKKNTTQQNIHIIGIGDNEAISVPRSKTENMIVNGKRIASRRNGQWLQQFAKQISASYQASELLGDSSLSQILHLPSPRIPTQANNQVLWNEWFFIPLMAGMFLFLLALQIKETNSNIIKKSAILLLMINLSACQLFPDAQLLAVRQALNSKDYTKAHQLASQLKGYQARLSQGIACYRLEDYPCALQSFSRAAWIADQPQQQGIAIFNLANSQFKLGNYQQASVLYRDAELHGIDTTKTRLNQSFADSLNTAVQQRINDIAETLRRAQWRSEANRIPDGFADRIAEGIYLSQPKDRSPQFKHLSVEQLNALINQGVSQTKQQLSGSTQLNLRSWVKSPQTAAAEDSAGLFNRLMPMEIGLSSTPKEPFLMEGQRAW